MTKAMRAAVWAMGALACATPPVAGQAPAPQIQNGRVETSHAASIDAALRDVPASDIPVWLVWREPMVDGAGQVCSTWSDGDERIRGTVLDARPLQNGPPNLAPASGPVPLEAGTGVLMLLRVVNGAPERLRTIDDSCPIDANGRVIHWLDRVTPTESLRYLGPLTRPMSLTDVTRRWVSSAVTAIALHRDAAADAMLDRLAAPDTDADIRDTAARAQARWRGAYGFHEVLRAITTERNTSIRQRLVAALRQSPVPAATGELLRIARSDENDRVRAEAVLGYAILAGRAGIDAVLDIAARDPSSEVQRRAVAGIARLPAYEGVPTLLSLARTTANQTLRKESVGALSRSDDPRAIAYMEELVRGTARN
jgi:HEAT repeats